MSPLPISDPAPLVAIVDDDDSWRSSTRMLVASFGFRAEAFARAKDFLTEPWLSETSCLVLDMVMPDLNGLELQWELARLRPSLPLIFITAHAREPAVRQAMIAGAVAVLRKPVAESVLLNTLRAALGHGEVQAKL